MEEGTQQIIALGVVACVVAAELLRRRRKKNKGASGCDNCDNPNGAEDKKETPLRFYRRR